MPRFKPTQQEIKEYQKKRAKVLRDNPLCLCGEKSVMVHHTKGRSKFFLDETTFVATCEKCEQARHNIKPKKFKVKGPKLVRGSEASFEITKTETKITSFKYSVTKNKDIELLMREWVEKKHNKKLKP